MKTSEEKHGVQWTAQNQLDDLDFADDLALLSRTHEQMQTKVASVAAASASNRPAQLNSLNIEVADTDPPMDVTKPIIEEINAAGSNSTPAEALKSDIKKAFDGVDRIILMNLRRCKSAKIYRQIFTKDTSGPLAREHQK
ncbi:unnamed protein product [Schistosoma curassoni]|uniref:Reverse transcriptase domain-containing protein n=1 Tax=Schistosoma curassoni TaxID=6186 RepID=A0A183KKX2_9TREM|nr:unnamed protein product [Schistosoma curassoni]